MEYIFFLVFTIYQDFAQSGNPEMLSCLYINFYVILLSLKDLVTKLIVVAVQNNTKRSMVL